MLVYTAKLTKKRIVAGIVAAAIILCAVIVAVSLPGNSDNEDKESTAAAADTVKNNKQRIAYLESYGWEVSESAIEEQDILIPEKFDGVYAEYNEIQKAQGFDLESYCGKEAVRYTYEILNYPGYTGTVVADMIIFKNHVIAGDIQATSLEGFMHGFDMPSSDSSAETTSVDNTEVEDVIAEDTPDEGIPTAETSSSDVSSDELPESGETEISDTTDVK